MIKIVGFGVRIPGFEFEFVIPCVCVCVCVCVCNILNILVNFAELQFLICKARIILIVIIIIGNIYLVLVMFPAVFCFTCIIALNHPNNPMREVM